MSAPIRILHVVDTLGKGGLENGLVNLIECLDPHQFEHVVCTMRAMGVNADRLPAGRVRVECLRKTSGSRFQFGALIRMIRQTAPDIVHSRNWAAIEAVAAARRLGIPVVHSEHGLEAEAGEKQPWRRIWFRRLAYRLANRVVSVSRQLGDMHARQTGFSKDRITVIHNGVDCRRFRPDAAARERVRKEWGLSGEDVCFGCVGNLLPVKGHMQLLEALAQLDVSAGWRLVILGEGPERAGLEAFVAAHDGLKGRVSLLGLSNSIPGLLNAMDVFVLPSLFEGISNALLEAMATGLPAVASATGGNPEVVVDGESGLLFPARDSKALASLLSLVAGNQELRLRLGGQALRRVREQFSLDSMARQYGRLYESLRPGARRPMRALVGA